MEEDLPSQFCAVTGADEQAAQHYLAAADYDLDAAVSLYLDQAAESTLAEARAIEPMRTEPPARQETRSPFSRQETRSPFSRGEVRAPIAPSRGRLVEDESFSSSLPFMISNLAPTVHSSSSYLGAGATDETGRRLAALYRPPLELFLPPSLTLEEARREARQQGKWLLINLHDPSEFGCQLMNRDVWNSPTVREQLLPVLAIQQLVVGCMEAERYLRLYPLAEEDLPLSKPHWALLDPRTGRRVKQGNRLPTPIEFIQEILDHLHESKREGVGMGPEDGGMKDESADKAHDEHQESCEGRMMMPGEEPGANDPQATTIQFRMPQGERVRRRFLLQEPVSCLFGHVSQLLPADHGRLEDLVAPPARSLKGELGLTIEQASLKNASLLVKLA